MKKIAKKLSLVLILAMLTGMFGGVVTASAASAWSFKTKSGIKLEINETINMEKNEFQDFNLYKSGVEILQSDRRYDVTWSSSDENVIWADSKNGKARADKFKTMKGEYGEAVITAKIRNRTTGAIAYRKFKVTVGVKPAELASIELKLGEGTEASETLELGKSYKLTTAVFDQNKKAYDTEKNEVFYKFFYDEAAFELKEDNTLVTKKVGEYKISVAAFIDEEEYEDVQAPEDAAVVTDITVYVEDNSPVITSIRQTELTKVEFSLNKETYVKELLENSKPLTLAYFVNGKEIPTSYQLLSAKENDPLTVVVSLYGSLSEGVEYVFRYTKDGKTLEKKLKGSGMTPAYIKLVSEPVEVETDYKIQVKVYNSANVDISSVIRYPVVFEALDSRYEYDYILSDNTLFFLTKGITAQIKATMDMPYDSNGNKLKDLVDIAHFTSVPKAEPIYFDCHAYSITDAEGTKKLPSLTYQDLPKVICADDKNLFLTASFTYYDTKKVESKQYIAQGKDSLGMTGYTYESADQNYLLVERSTGELYPLRKGNAAVKILNPKGDVVGVATVRISEDRMLNNFAVINQGPVTMSATGDTTGIETVSYGLKAMDQNGEEIKNVTYSYRIVYPENSAPFETLFNYSNRNNVLKIWENTDLKDEILPGSTKAFNIEISAYYGTKLLKQQARVVVKNTIGETAARTALRISQERVDTRLDKGSLSEYESTIQICTYDSSGYLISTEEIKPIYAASEASKERNKYSLLIQRNGEKITGEEFVLSADKKTLTMKPVVETGLVIKKAKIGVYDMKLYQGLGTQAQLKAPGSIVLVDTTEPIIVTQKQKTAPGAELAQLKDYLVYTWNGKDITEYVSPNKADIIRVNNLCHISKLEVTVRLDGLNEAWRDDYNIQMEIKTGIQFTIQ